MPTRPSARRGGLPEGLLPTLDSVTRTDLRGYGADLAEMLRRTFGTQLPPSLARSERRLRDRTGQVPTFAQGVQ